MSSKVVIDLEMCRVSRGAKRNCRLNMEIIQIGAVLLDDDFCVVDKFNCFVKPEYGKLDGFIHKLTGIEEDKLQSAQLLGQVLDSFSEWIPSDEVEIVSWSMTDRDQLVREMNRKGIENDRIEKLFEKWIDAQKIYDDKVGAECGRQYSLAEALVAGDIVWEGDAHDGYYDAYNTALLYKKLMCDKEFKLNSFYLISKQDETEHLTTSFGDLFDKMDLSLLAM